MVEQRLREAGRVFRWSAGFLRLLRSGHPAAGRRRWLGAHPSISLLEVAARFGGPPWLPAPTPRLPSGCCATD